MSTSDLMKTSIMESLGKEVAQLTKELEEEIAGSPLYAKLFGKNADPAKIGTGEPKISKSEAASKVENLRDKKRKLATETATRKSTTSAKFQWLPTDYQINENGKVSTLSYINNLDPSIIIPLLLISQVLIFFF